MLWAAVYSNGSKLMLVLTELGVKENSKVYQNMLVRYVLPSHFELFTQDRPIWYRTSAEYIYIFWSQIGLHQCLILILWTLRYNAYWSAIFPYLMSQSWKKPSRYRRNFSVKKVVKEYCAWIWEEIKGYVESKYRPF